MTTAEKVLLLRFLFSLLSLCLSLSFLLSFLHPSVHSPFWLTFLLYFYGQVGMYSQCTHASHKHRAIVVSMGDGDITGSRCSLSWAHTCQAVASADMKHTIRPTTATERQAEDRVIVAREG